MLFSRKRKRDPHVSHISTEHSCPDQVWKDCPLVGPNHECSSCGYVRNKYSHHYMGTLGNHGFYQLVSATSRKMLFLHRIILETFSGPRPNKDMVACHINGDPKDCHISNLKWISRSTKMKDVHIQQLDKNKNRIQQRNPKTNKLEEVFESQRAVRKKLKISSALQGALDHPTKLAGGYRWTRETRTVAMSPHDVCCIDEKWEPIKYKGIVSIYLVSSCGRVKNNIRGTFVHPQIKPSGYKIVTLSIDKKHKTLKVHRLVAKAFLTAVGEKDDLVMAETSDTGDEMDDQIYVSHKDQDKNNNHSSNLVISKGSTG